MSDTTSGYYRPSPATVEVELIGFWARVAAFFIDFLLVMAVTALPAILIAPDSPAGAMVFVAALYLYYVLLTGLNHGQTLGKKALKIQVVDSSGQPPGLGRAIMRELLGRFVSSAICYLGYFWVALDGQKRGWHDYVAGTYVVRRLT